MVNVEHLDAIRRGSEDDQRLDDFEFLERALKANAAAIRLVKKLIEICHVWDDLVDGDRVEKDAVTSAFWAALIEIPRNPFFQAHLYDLTAIFASAATGWRISNGLVDMGDKHAAEIAHVLRSSLADVIVYCALLIGGPDWAAEVGPEIYLRSQRDSVSDFLTEQGHEC